jgi:hypothetical protein
VINFIKEFTFQRSIIILGFIPHLKKDTLVVILFYKKAMSKYLAILLFFIHFSSFSQKAWNLEIEGGASLSTTLRYSPWSTQWNGNYLGNVYAEYEKKNISFGTGISFYSIGGKYKQYIDNNIGWINKIGFKIHNVGIPIYTKYQSGSWSFTLGLVPSITVYATGSDNNDHEINGSSVNIITKRINSRTQHFNSTNVIKPFTLASYFACKRYLKNINPSYFVGMRYGVDVTRSLNYTDFNNSGVDKFHSISIILGKKFNLTQM